MSPEEKRFYDNLIKEMDTIRNFNYNDAQPDGELRLLDRDALQQLESALAVEDQ